MRPLTYQRWALFRKNTRAFVSLWIFVCVFAVSAGAYWLANDHPLLVMYKGHLYFPLLKAYPETQFGGVFETEADYNDPAVQALIEEHGWMIKTLIPYSYDTFDVALQKPVPSPPSRRHWLGTDDHGRDVLSRLLYGLRVSIFFGLILTLVSSVIGFIVGVVQGYFGGMVDLLGQRVIEIWSSMPALFILMIFSSVVVPNFWWLLLFLLLFSWSALTGYVRAEVLKVRKYDYIRAAQALGVGDISIMARHVLPNAAVAALTFLPFIAASSLVTLTSLDFLGFGLPPGSPSLGELLKQGKDNLYAPWLVLTAFTSMSFILSLLIFIGEGVRDAFDPHA